MTFTLGVYRHLYQIFHYSDKNINQFLIYCLAHKACSRTIFLFGPNKYANKVHNATQPMCMRKVSISYLDYKIIIF